ncbi:MAG: hypothetical protein AMJ78_03275 [Omnitrophica WOR_2 bacterium SM23_29]|nr:MAG: hypothetical protein AMJ78_03275 [Omnitrophica WOR_2 bacterium SM23_29]
MSGLHQSELNNVEGESKVKEKLLTLEEAADFLGLSEEEVRAFVAQGKIPAYKLGGEFLRFKKDQIEALRARIQILKSRSAFVDETIEEGKAEEKKEYSAWERIQDFIYFSDFYLFAAVLILILIFIISRHR